MKTSQIESITKAAQCADLLVNDVVYAHRIACDGDPALQILLLDVIGDARRIKERLALIESAIAPKVSLPAPVKQRPKR
jgi:hypothetical protein